MRTFAKPFTMGLIMGAMMLWMVHGQMTGQSSITGWAAIAFVGIHILLILAIIGAAVFAARLSPRAKALIDRLHRPSVSHVLAMFIGVALLAAVTHLILHGGF